MSNPVVIRVVRPYRSADEYIAAEAWSIETKTMLLVGARARPVGTAVRFDVALESGEKVIRAEGTVVRHVEPGDDRPGGLEVRFKKFGGTTKAFLERAHAARAAPGKRRATRKSARPELASIPDPPPPESTDELPSAPEAAEPSQQIAGDIDAEPVSVVIESELDPESTSGATPPAESPDEPKARAPGAPIPPPEGRDELLERLRERARDLVKARGADWFFSRSSRDG